MVIFAVLVGGFAIEFSLEATTTDEFCVSCHEMGDNISGSDEDRLHLVGSGELHGQCADCHLPRAFLPRLRRKLRASADVYHHLLGTLDSPESFEARRLQLAQRVWARMKHNDSVECRSCHADLQSARAGAGEIVRAYHERADRNGVGCIDCHKGLTHRMPALPSSRRQAFDPERCFTCHTRENVLATPRTSHAEAEGLTSAEARAECVKCHGDGEGHMEFPIRGERIRFDAFVTADPINREGACIDCHAADENPRWRLATHGLSDTACVSCHSIHRPGDGPLLRSLREPLCADSCHIAIASDGGDSERTTREARTCTACHDPHSPGGGERCMSCHPQGPGDLAEETPEARTFHLRGQAEGILCVQCHKGMLHRIPHAQLSKL
jgi:nitrate/TMAO reductase-like tetraheme cytochrome c subunit